MARAPATKQNIEDLHHECNLWCNLLFSKKSNISQLLFNIMDNPFLEERNSGMSSRSSNGLYPTAVRVLNDVGPS